MAPKSGGTVGCPLDTKKVKNSAVVEARPLKKDLLKRFIRLTIKS
jgi:hypothetical protein